MVEPVGAGCSFDEDFVDLLELNGYRGSKTGKSDGGGSEIAASRIDEVGQEIAYIIHHIESEVPLTEADLDRIERRRENLPGRITVILSPSAGFSRSATDLAARRGVRLWGPQEVDRLRRNVAEKRGLRPRGEVDRSIIGAKGKRRRSRSKAKAAAVLLLLLSVALLYAKFGGIDPLEGLSDLAGEIGFFDLDLVEFQRSSAPVVREAAWVLSEKISGLLRGWHKA